MPDDDLRTLLRDFRASVATDLEATHRRMDSFTDEARRRANDTNERIRGLEEKIDRVDERLRIAEIAIVNEIRALAERFDRRLARLEES